MHRANGSQRSVRSSRSIESKRSALSRRSSLSSSQRRQHGGGSSSRGAATTSSFAAPLSADDDGGSHGAPPMEPSAVCMTVVSDAARIAFACYHEDWNEIILEDIPVGGYDCDDVTRRFLQSVRPNMMLLSNKIVSNEPLLEILTHIPPPLSPPSDEDEDDGTEGPNRQTANEAPTPAESKGTLIPYRLLKSGMFDVRSCQEIILQKLRVMSFIRGHATPGLPGIANSFVPSRYHAMASVVDFDSKIQVQALGSLLSYLQSTIFSSEDGGTITVNNVVQARTSMYMGISPSTFASLHIFSTEHHPLMASQGGHSKEGWSLYSLLDRTRSKGGSQVLKEWMQKPLLDIDAINERQDAVSLCMDSQFQSTIGTIIQMLTKVGPVGNILGRIQKCTTKPTDFVVLGRTLSAALAIHRSLRQDIIPKIQSMYVESEDQDNGEQSQLTGQGKLIEDMGNRCAVTSIMKLQELITSIVDDEETMEQKTTVVVRSGYSSRLDSLRDQYEALDDTLDNIGDALRLQYPGLPISSVIFVPQVGFLIIFVISALFGADGNLMVALPEDFEHIFNSDGQCFFKNETMRKADHDIGDLDGFIKDAERAIVSELEDIILEVESDLRDTFRALSELDCIISFAECAANSKYVRPQMTDASQQSILIENGRHPLQEVISETEYVPNDTLIDDTDRINVITGPNYSGKSCYARQVGVLVYMAHIGCFLPCDRAVISLTDNIIARISNTETCAVPQSSFQLDLTQMAAGLRQSSPNTLFLIDEFGKGTSPASGVAMLAAALKKLSELKCRVICTTHFLELFTMNLMKDGEGGVKALQMAYVLPAPGEDDTATPLFKLTQGVASTSAGLVCAKLAGINPSVVRRARDINRAVREGRTVEPMTSSVVPSIRLPKKAMLRIFLAGEDWEKADDKELGELIRSIARS